MTKGSVQPGERFGALTVVERVDAYPAREIRWRCACDCGGERVARTARLRNGEACSCGCLSTLGSPRRPGIVTYQTAHYRVRADRGKARDQACVDCGAQAAEWSYDGTDPDEVRGLTADGRTVSAYSTDPAYYVPRCKHCHGVFDKVTRRR